MPCQSYREQTGSEIAGNDLSWLDLFSKANEYCPIQGRVDATRWWIFALAALMATGIALLTVSYQAIKAAVVNPVAILKTE